MFCKLESMLNEYLEMGVAKEARNSNHWERFMQHEKDYHQENEMLHSRVAELNDSLQKEESEKTALQLELDNSIRKLEHTMKESKGRLQKAEEECQSKLSSDIATVLINQQESSTCRLR